MKIQNLKSKKWMEKINKIQKTAVRHRKKFASDFNNDSTNQKYFLCRCTMKKMCGGQAFHCCSFYNPICSFMCAPNATMTLRKSEWYKSNGTTMKLKHQPNLSKPTQTEAHIKPNIIKTQARIVSAQTEIKSIIIRVNCEFEKYEILFRIDCIARFTLYVCVVPWLTSFSSLHFVNVSQKSGVGKVMVSECYYWIK